MPNIYVFIVSAIFFFLFAGVAFDHFDVVADVLKVFQVDSRFLLLLFFDFFGGISNSDLALFLPGLLQLRAETDFIHWLHLWRLL